MTPPELQEGLPKPPHPRPPTGGHYGEGPPPEAEAEGDRDFAVEEAERVAAEVFAKLATTYPPAGPNAVRRTSSAFPSAHAPGGAPARRGGRKPRPTIAPPPEPAGGEGPVSFHGLVGGSEIMREVLREIERAARTEVTVLLIGESGTGKELAARAIHLESRRRPGPFVPLHTGAIPRELVASELFGHERGAFTGASRSQRGKFEIANLGTLFLDEISTMDQHAQVSLLRVMEDREFARVGAETMMRVDVRVVAATNADLWELVDKGDFREDLYYRLNVFPIRLPPLRARRSDIDILAEHFRRLFAAESGIEVDAFAPEALELMRAYSWPGNVRELKNAVQRAMIRCERGQIAPEHLPDRVRGRAAAPLIEFELGLKLGEVEKRYISETLARCQGNKKETAKVLGISRKSLYNKLTRYKIG